MKGKLTVHQRRAWQERMRVIGAIALALIAAAGLFVTLRPPPATAQSTDSQSADQTPRCMLRLRSRRRRPLRDPKPLHWPINTRSSAGTIWGCIA